MSGQVGSWLVLVALLALGEKDSSLAVAGSNGDRRGRG